mmetsp:Transcript_10433/g.29480  ORF Transcript_10433/g.29480 Transcript_10433/m.29480 type:complete len:292 (-) Transcript_10433:97-972(-)
MRHPRLVPGRGRGGHEPSGGGERGVHDPLLRRLARAAPEGPGERRPQPRRGGLRDGVGDLRGLGRRRAEPRRGGGLARLPPAEPHLGRQLGGQRQGRGVLGAGERGQRQRRLGAGPSLQVRHLRAHVAPGLSAVPADDNDHDRDHDELVPGPRRLPVGAHRLRVRARGGRLVWHGRLLRGAPEAERQGGGQRPGPAQQQFVALPEADPQQPVAEAGRQQPVHQVDFQHLRPLRGRGHPQQPPAQEPVQDFRGHLRAAGGGRPEPHTRRGVGRACLHHAAAPACSGTRGSLH